MDQVLAGLMQHAPTMGKVAKLSYSHQDMIDTIIAQPGISQGELAARYGFTQGWICNVMASDAWKSAMAARREEILDPQLRLTVDERFRALTTRSLERLMEKLDAPQVSDQTVLRAVELGAKAMGVGGNAAPPAPTSDHLAHLAERLLLLQSQVRERLVGGEIKGVTYENAA